MQIFIDELMLFLKSSSILLGNSEKKAFETDWRDKFYGSSIAVLFPQSTDDIQKIIDLCRKYNVKITPQGGNTSTSGGSVPSNDNHNHVIISLSKLNKIIELDAKNNSLTVEAGCTLLQVKNFAEEHNFYFPLKIGSEGSCQIGGNISTNAGGINVLKYGTMRDSVLGLEAVLPDGTIINQLTKLRKNNTNFDLKQLFIGSEGTLGIITKATLKLYSKPLDYFTCFIGLDSIEECINCLAMIKSNQIMPSAFEVINKQAQQVYNLKFADHKIPIASNWIILCEIEINDVTGLDYVQETLSRVIKSYSELIIASNNKERENIWQIRENIPIAEKLFGFAIKYDISLPISNIPDFITTNEKNLLKYQFPRGIIIFGHLGDGNLHYNIPLNDIELSERDINQINDIVYSDVTVLGGSISAEHGIGQLKTKWFQKFYDKNSYSLARAIKYLIDPLGIFNPGKVFPE